MSARPPLPRGFPPSALPTAPRPRPASATSQAPSTPAPPPPRPKRPLSASRVPTTASVNAAFRQRSSTPSTPSTRQRPASASRVRATITTSTLTTHDDEPVSDDDVDIVPFPSPRLRVTEADVHPVDTSTGHAIPIEQPATEPPSRMALAKAEQFLLHWQKDEGAFRSPLLFAESTFVQAKAMTASELPQPNVFLSSVAFGALELVCQTLKQQHPFVTELLDVVGSALFSNHTALKTAASSTTSASRFLLYMQQGRFCFDQLHAHDEQVRVLRSAIHKASADATRLREQLQKQHVTRLFERVQARVKTAASATVDDSDTHSDSQYPQLRRVLYGDAKRGAHFNLQEGEYAFEPCAEEVALFFNSLPPLQASALLSRLQQRAAERQLPQLGESYAVTVDLLPEPERKAFLREYVELVGTEELLAAVRERSDHDANSNNQEQQWQSFLDEMKDVLRVDDAANAAAFHSDEARVGAKIYEVVDLLQELAAEVSLADEAQPVRVSKELVTRLSPFVTTRKKVEKLRQLMMATPVGGSEDSKLCGCFCGQHSLVPVDGEGDQEQLAVSEKEPQEHTQVIEEGETRSSKRKSTRSSRGKRKGSSSTRQSTRSSLTTVRLFPLQETCHIVSLVVQLQFARDSGGAGASTRRGSTQSSDITKRLPSFKALAKDYLTRKYGIKSIAIMHVLQLEKSLLHYAAMESHPRCELFAWFIGGDKTRSHYRDVGYQFYLRLVRVVAATMARKPVDVMTHAELITTWTDCIGDGDPRVGGGLLSGMQCADVVVNVLPTWMKEHAVVQAAVERYKAASDTTPIELFLKQAMLLWETRFVTMLTHVEASILGAVGPPPPLAGLDLALFRKAMQACGVDLTSAQALEQFDSLVVDGDISAPVAKAALFVMETKYLR